MRCFGYFSHVLAVGSNGEDLIASATRCINAWVCTPIAVWIRAPITNLLKAAVNVDFGPADTGGKLKAVQLYPISHIGRGVTWRDIN